MLRPSPRTSAGSPWSTRPVPPGSGGWRTGWSCGCGDGLGAIAPGEADTVVIAGMGGDNIVDILSGRSLDPGGDAAPPPAYEPTRDLAPVAAGERLRRDSGGAGAGQGDHLPHPVGPGRPHASRHRRGGLRRLPAGGGPPVGPVPGGPYLAPAQGGGGLGPGPGRGLGPAAGDVPGCRRGPE